MSAEAPASLSRREAIEAAVRTLIAEGIKPEEITSDMLLAKMGENGASQGTHLAVKESADEVTLGQPDRSSSLTPSRRQDTISFATKGFNLLAGKTYHPPVKNRAELKEREGQYNLVLEQIKVEDFALRRAIESRFRQIVAVPAVAVVGVVDGLFEAAAIGVAEFAETVPFAIALTLVRVQEGWKRGINSGKH